MAAERGVTIGVALILDRLAGEPPRLAIGFGGCREWDDRYEEEAVWLSGVLLVPRDGAFAVLRRGDSLAEGAMKFGVTIDLFRWRVNVTGTKRVIARL